MCFSLFFQNPTPNREYTDLTYISHLDSSEQPTLFAQPLQQHSEPLNQILYTKTQCRGGF